MTWRASIHEGLLVALGVAAGLALLLSGIPLAGWVLLMVAVYAVVIGFTLPGDKTRLIAAYAVAWAYYAGSSVLVEALQVPLRHQELLAADTALFDLTPFTGTLPAGVNDLLSAGYLSYHVYLHWAVIDALFRDGEWRWEMGKRLFTAFALGFIGYLTFPAAPPAQAFPELYTQPLAGGVITSWNTTLNAALAARYDAFPSLHALITLMLLSWDWSHFRTRFQIMLVPSLLMLVATLALRLHYAVDLIVSCILFALLHVLFERKRARRLGP
jgi:hypothetical protein